MAKNLSEMSTLETLGMIFVGLIKLILLPAIIVGFFGELANVLYNRKK